MKAKLDLLKMKVAGLGAPKVGLLILLITIPFLVLAIAKVNTNKNPQAPIAESKYLYIKDYYFDQSKTFYFEFSDSVDLHQLEHHFSVSPEIEGQLQKDGFGNKKFKFVATSDVPENTYITITISTGLTSENRKPFIDDFFMSFDNTNSDDTEEIFSKGQLDGKIMSFTSDKPVEITVKKHSKAREMTFNIYRSDNANLLNFLAYKVIEKGDEDYKYDDEEFIRTSIPHDKTKLIKTETIKEKVSQQKLSLTPGVYYFEATDGNKKIYGASFAVVSKNGVILRQDDQKITMANFNLNSGNKASENTEAVFYNLKDSPTRVGQANFSDLERGLNAPFSQRVDAALVTIGNETVFIPLKLPLSLAEIQARRDFEKTSNLFIYTDRPIYKPGDKVYFRGIVRTDSDSLYKMPSAGTPIYITIIDNNTDDDSTKLTVLTDSKGVFSGDFTIAKDKKPTPQYNTEFISASLSPSEDDIDYYNRSYGSANYIIARYVKPKYEIKVEAQNPDTLRHEKPKFVITGRYFSGQPMANEAVEYEAFTIDFYESEKMVYNKNFNINQFGGMCGGGGFDDDYYGESLGEAKKIRLDTNGQATVETPTDTKALLSQKITVTAKKTDDSKNEIVGADSSIRHAGAFNLFIIPSASSYKSGDATTIPFYTEELNGEKVANKEFSYKLLEYDYGSDRSSEKAILAGKTTTDESGKGNVSFIIPALSEGYKYLIIGGTDRFGNTVENRKSIYISKEESSNYAEWEDNYDTFLKVSSAQNSYQLGQNINLVVNSPADLDVLLTFERGRIYNPQILHLTKGENKITFPVTVEHSPSITPVFSFFHNGIYYTEGLSLNIPAMHKLLNISVTTDKNEYKTGENAEVKIKVKDASGNPIPAQLSMGIVDKAIYALRKSATPALHSEFYYFRNRTTNASSSLTWVGIYNYGGRGGGGGGGSDSLNKLVDTLYWNPNIQTDANGEVTLSVPLGSTNTTWKALVIGSDESTNVGQSDAEFLVK